MFKRFQIKSANKSLINAVKAETRKMKCKDI